ncbi:hypothetical protein NDU88_003409 [Pleurodeles waltl]|uniref:Uncharacterized protein n=1 Tax=Pleurodeles waltl TaxID=8319 RepID=A0AAV7T6I8_PLEWA|nr:hypothetical protein NDU88_003409 [Pleurodeles waltl]
MRQGSGHPWRARSATNQAMRHTVLPAAQSAAHRNTAGRAAHRPSSEPAPQRLSKIRVRHAWQRCGSCRDRCNRTSWAGRLIRISRNSRQPSWIQILYSGEWK